MFRGHELQEFIQRTIIMMTELSLNGVSHEVRRKIDGVMPLGLRMTISNQMLREFRNGSK